MRERAANVVGVIVGGGFAALCWGGFVWWVVRLGGGS